MDGGIFKERKSKVRNLKCKIVSKELSIIMGTFRDGRDFEEIHFLFIPQGGMSLQNIAG